MRLLNRIILGLLNCTGVYSALTRRQTINDNDFPLNPPSTACGDIVDIDGLKDYGPWFFASEVYDCITSVPFNSAVATRFIKYYNETLQFHSTIQLLKAPPSSYKQPAVDLIGRLNTIQANVDAGAYHNQYAFEADIQKMVQSAHDSHVVLYAGVLNQFTFGSYYDIVTLSEDGVKTPEVYIHNGLLEDCIAQPDCVPSPIDTFNGIPAVQFLTEFAEEQSMGLVEPHADWNQLMFSPALDIQGGLSTFGGNAQLYPGDELNITLRNGSRDYDSYWTSLYNSPGYTGPLLTGGDFFNFFVLGNVPPSFNATPQYLESISQDGDLIQDDSSPDIRSWHKINPAYPNTTVVYQPGLGYGEVGVLTGYMLDDISTAVLSIPSFDSDIGTFSRTVTEFVNSARKRQADKIVIDLQQNTGGQVALALWTFAQFFPGRSPYTGSRMRAHDSANVLGQTFNHQLGNDSSGFAIPEFLISEWVVTDRINAETGQNFSSWDEYFGPLPQHNDFFTRIQEYNLSSEAFDYWNLNAYGDFASTFSAPDDQQPPWSPENIVLLTDGLCASTCTLFVELMKQESGIRTVVVGGRPETGPMQAASGSRGAASYSSFNVDADIDQVLDWFPSAQDELPTRGNATDPGMLITYAGINLRDQIKKTATSPNQFSYVPADCRIYWTFANYNNYLRLWHDAWDAIYNNTALCVAGSTGVAAFNSLSRRDSATTNLPTDQPFNVSTAILQGIGLTPDLLPGSGVAAGFDILKRGFPPRCNSKAPTNQCPSGTTCTPVTNQCCDSPIRGSCRNRGQVREERCVQVFSGNNGQCSSDLCQETTVRTDNSKVNGGGGRSLGSAGYGGSLRASIKACYPRATTYNEVTCQALRKEWDKYDGLF